MKRKSKKNVVINRARKIERNKKRRKGKEHIVFYYDIKYLFAKKFNLCYTSNLQKVLEKSDFYKKVDIRDLVKIKIPKIFCFIRNADETLEILKKISYVYKETNIKKVFFDYSECEVLGLDASVVTDALVLDGREYRKSLNSPLELTGNFPKSDSAYQIFINSGLLKHLKISENIDDPFVERLDPFIKTKDSNELTNKVIQYYQHCLNRNGCQLTLNGIGSFTNMVGEIIDNLGNHSGENGYWLVSGHFSQINSNQLGKGTLTFISFGDTIYESLKSPGVSEKIRKKLELHTKCHNKLFELGSWNEEASWTVFALQYKISRLNNEKDPDRGTGTIKFIDSFSVLGKTFENDKPLMAIVSGNTHILFDGTYTLKTKIIRNKPVQVIAFNKENDLKKRPDKNAVKILKNKFPGTIITVEFFVDKRYLKSIKEEKYE